MYFDASKGCSIVEVKRIGAGGMAELFLADLSSASGVSKRVVLKRMRSSMATDPVCRALFLNEARIHAELNHPHIVQLFDVGADRNCPFLTLEYIEGGDLRSLSEILFARDDNTRLEATLRMLSEISSALVAVHKIAVHQDISPSNILFSQRGYFKLCDFGLARRLTESADAEKLTGQGKFRYMSPEQIGGRATDPRSDVFSLAVCAAEFYSGQKLYTGLSRDALLQSLRKGSYLKQVEQLDLPEALRNIVLRAVQPSPKDRFADAYELMQSALSAGFGLRCHDKTNSLRWHDKPVSLARLSKILTLALVSPVLLFVPGIVKLISFLRYCKKKRTRQRSRNTLQIWSG